MKSKKAEDKTIAPMAVRLSAIEQLREIVELLSRPGGFAKLNLDQRKFILGVTMAAVVPADMKIRHGEVAHLQQIINTRLKCPKTMSEDIVSLACSKPQSSEVTDALARVLPELLGADDLANIIGGFWELAIADQDLHASEEQLVYRMADIAGVPRKRVAEQLARAQSRMA